MEEDNVKTRFSIEDFDFLSPVYAVYSFWNEEKQYVPIETGNWNFSEIEDEGFVKLSLGTKFKNIEDENTLPIILELDKKIGERVTEIEAVWYGNPKNLPYISAHIIDDDMSESIASIPLEDGTDEQLLNVFLAEIKNKHQ